MKESSHFMKKYRRKILGGLGLLLVLLAAFFTWYVNDDYDAADRALTALTTTEQVEVIEGNPIQFLPQNEEETHTGIIFYPGGKVEEEAYAPIMQAFAEEGYAVFLADMPFGLAVLDINAAEDIITDNPDITNWYIMGHSLGGSMAAIFAEGNLNSLAGLILLAAYSTADLSQTDLPVLSILASEDEVLDSAQVEENRPLLPDDAVEVIIEGGNHAQFGSYGLQEGDGEASISEIEQQQAVIDAVLTFIEANN